ncbi:uncharacterized protein SOCE26_020440 [Sorangium cellulosum]|uniref:Uncharacterized protein n=1 Tax=Sorangium cellulosum TaxID=56 RepID=A0A2L0EMV8_SORCE|nr:uncharacterized protein SOCE26_020440 [Sorangium cellulosum]
MSPDVRCTTVTAPLLAGLRYALARKAYVIAPRAARRA